MLPTRSTLESWNPDSLTAGAKAVETGGDSVRDAVSGIRDGCERLPEVRAWSGVAHDAATDMFVRADTKGDQFAQYTSAVAKALNEGAESIGHARRMLLDKADEVDAGPLNVTDQWVVLIDPAYMSEDEMTKLQTLARQEQSAVNAMLVAVGEADSTTADAIIAAGQSHGFVPPSPPTDFGGMMLPTAQRPPDQIPDPQTPVGMMAQEAVRSADEQQNVREVIESTNEHGEEVTTVIKQDGSKAVTTRMDPFEWPSKQDFYEMEEFDKNGEFVARTSSWHDLSNDSDYTSITYADGSNMTMSMDPTGYRRAGFTTADGRHSTVPVELIDDMSLGTSSVMSGLEKHVARGGSLPMLTEESIEKVGKSMKFGGPALGVATTVFDMAMADSGKDRCIALVAGMAGGGGGWAMAEAGAAVGALTGPGAPIAVPVLAVAGALGGGRYGADFGEFVGDVLCPY